MSEEPLIRLQKIIARSGMASRREAERLIVDGFVCVNGRQVHELGTKVFSSDRVTVRGEDLPPASLVYMAINKPRGYECSNEPNSKFTGIP